MKYADTDIHINVDLLHRVEEKKKRLDNLRPLSPEALQQLLDDIRLRHTYHSDAIEGNTLSLQETKLMLEEGITIGGKPLKDHIEAKNDAEAFDLMMTLAQNKENLTQEKIQKINECVTKGILNHPGCYRTENVGITGADVRPPSFQKIIRLMDTYINTINSNKIHPIKKAAYIHHELARIHPFYDGNGRTARLLTNFYLITQGYPPIIIKKQDRKTYYETLRKADHGNLSAFAIFITQLLNESLQLYLSVFVEEDHLIPLKELAKSSPYSQEYLSLRARQGILDAVKIENTWYSSKRALQQYIVRFANKT